MARFKETIAERCFKLINAFQNGREMTCKDVETLLNITRHSAQAYIDALSRQMPIYESGKKPGIGGGPPATTYKLIK